MKPTKTAALFILLAEITNTVWYPSRANYYKEAEQAVEAYLRSNSRPQGGARKITQEVNSVVRNHANAMTWTRSALSSPLSFHSCAK